MNILNLEAVFQFESIDSYDNIKHIVLKVMITNVYWAFWTKHCSKMFTCTQRQAYQVFYREGNWSTEFESMPIGGTGKYM